MNRRPLALVLMLTSLATGANVHAGTDYAESTAGDLSGDRLAPTSLVLSAGSNLLTGSVRDSESVGGDIDYLTLILPALHRLNALILSSVETGGQRAFMAVQSGHSFTVAPIDAAVQTGELLGWAHFSGADVGLDVLAGMGARFGVQGFVPPLPPGAYTFWIQEQAGTTRYSFDFQVTAIPEPVSYALFLAGMIVVLGIARVRTRACNGHS